MNEVTQLHEIAIFIMCLSWVVYSFFKIKEHKFSKAILKSFWAFVLVNGAIVVMAFSSSIELVLGVITGVIANELSHKINKHRD